jgi:uncharacterized membrane protein YfcA
MSSVTDRTLPLSAIATRRFGKLQWTAARAVLIGAVVFALLPLFASEYWLNAVLIPFLAMSLAGIGLNLLMGTPGRLRSAPARSWPSVLMRPTTFFFVCPRFRCR